MRLSRVRVRELVDFTGWSTIRALCVLWSFGLILLTLELSFAYLFQHFLVALELISIPRVEWFSLRLSLNQTIVLIILVAFARSTIGFAQAVIGGGAIEGFSHRLRRRLIQACLNARTVKTAETLTFFNERIYTASIAIQSFQTVLVQGTLTAGLLISLFWMSPAPTMLLLVVVAIALFPLQALNRPGNRPRYFTLKRFRRSCCTSTTCSETSY